MNRSIKKFEANQDNAAIDITSAIRGTNTGKFYQELGLGSLENRGKLRRLFLYYEICKDHTTFDLLILIFTKFKSFYS